jgi:hypothetical protein
MPCITREHCHIDPTMHTYRKASRMILVSWGFEILSSLHHWLGSLPWCYSFGASSVEYLSLLPPMSFISPTDHATVYPTYKFLPFCLLSLFRLPPLGFPYLLQLALFMSAFHPAKLKSKQTAFTNFPSRSPSFSACTIPNIANMLSSSSTKIFPFFFP